VSSYKALAPMRNTIPAQKNSTEGRGIIREFIGWADFDPSSEVAAPCRVVPLRPSVFFESPRAMAYRLANSLSCKR
jgi:hypothetical protein